MATVALFIILTSMPSPEKFHPTAPTALREIKFFFGSETFLTFVKVDTFTLNIFNLILSIPIVLHAATFPIKIVPSL